MADPRGRPPYGEWTTPAAEPHPAPPGTPFATIPVPPELTVLILSGPTGGSTMLRVHGDLTLAAAWLHQTGRQLEAKRQLPNQPDHCGICGSAGPFSWDPADGWGCGTCGWNDSQPPPSPAQLAAILARAKQRGRQA